MKDTKAIRHRIIIALVCTLLLLGGLAVWTRFSGNPLIMYRMRGNVLRYLQEKYPSTEFTFLGASYDFLNRAYGASVRVTGDQDLTFTVNGRSAYTDDYQERRLDHEATDALKSVVQSVLPGATVMASVTLPEGQAYAGTHFAPALQANLSTAIGWRDPNATKETFVRTALVALDALHAQGYNLSSCDLWCELGDKEYALMLEGMQLQLDADDLAKLVLQPGKW